jgi:hypothetical protein
LIIVPLSPDSRNHFGHRDVLLDRLGFQKACLLFAELDLHPDHVNAIMMSNNDVIILSNDVVWKNGERLRQLLQQLLKGDVTVSGSQVHSTASRMLGFIGNPNLPLFIF